MSILDGSNGQRASYHLSDTDVLSLASDEVAAQARKSDRLLAARQAKTAPDANDADATTMGLSSMIPQTVQSLSRWPIIMDSSPWAAYISQNSTPLTQTRINDEATEGLESSAKSTLSLSQCMALVERYLETSNMENPILDPVRLRPLVSQAYLDNFRLSIESCLALLVCANGAISSPFGADFGRDRTADYALADKLFRFAEQRLGMAFTAGSVAGAQVLYLSGVFHMCKFDHPIHPWISAGGEEGTKRQQHRHVLGHSIRQRLNANTDDWTRPTTRFRSMANVPRSPMRITEIFLRHKFPDPMLSGPR